MPVLPFVKALLPTFSDVMNTTPDFDSLRSSQLEADQGERG